MQTIFTTKWPVYSHWNDGRDIGRDLLYYYHVCHYFHHACHSFHIILISPFLVSHFGIPHNNRADKHPNMHAGCAAFQKSLIARLNANAPEKEKKVGAFPSFLFCVPGFLSFVSCAILTDTRAPIDHEVFTHASTTHTGRLLDERLF